MASDLPTGAISVLDKGYVRLVDKMGTDLSPVNAARVSFDKESSELSDKDTRLIAYLARNNEGSPFRHAMMTFEVYAPLMVARQWWKYVVGSSHQDNMLAWNESSRRYITEEPTFYVPKEGEWRGTPENKKQGSGEPIAASMGAHLTTSLEWHYKQSENLYAEAMAAGVAPEQARLFLPAYGMYVRWRWTASLEGVKHFLEQRLEHKAQHEIHEYAVAVEKLVRETFPVSIAAWLDKKE